MSAREPSQAELLSAAAKQAASGKKLCIPGIIKAYDPLFRTVEVVPAVIAEDEDGAGEPITAAYRAMDHSGFMLAWTPLPGEHCSLIFHGLDPSAFLAAPTGAARAALVQEDSVSCEAWPATYLPLAPLPPVGTAWFGASTLTSGVAVTAAGVGLGTPAADAPLVRGTELVTYLGLLTVYLGLLQAWIATAGPVGAPPVSPPIPPTLLSLLVRTT